MNTTTTHNFVTAASKPYLLSIIFIFLFYSSNMQSQGALDFDGVDDHVSIPNSASLNLTTSATYEAWVYWRGGFNLFMKGNYGYGVGLYGEIEWWQQFSQGSGPNSSGASISTGQWTHIAVTIVNNGELKFYKNGALISTSGGHIVNNSGALFLGQQGQCYCNRMSMQLDEFRIWNVVKTQAEIQASMNAPLSGPQPNLMAYYDFEDGSGTTLTDKSGNGNHGILVNMDGNTDWVAGNYGASSVTTPDTTPPVISLTGANPQTIEVGVAYAELGATASDDTDGDISNNISISGVQGTNTVGSFTVSYNVSDAAGNPATTVTRTVNVVDTTAPVITSTVLVQEIDEGGTALGQFFADETVTWSINDYNNVGLQISTDGFVTITAGAVLGNQYHYDVTATDVSPNLNYSTSGQTIVTVNDITGPVIVLNTPTIQTIEVGTAYSELGATATDNLDAANTLTVVPTVNNENTAVVGSFTVDYNVSDAAGNPATTVTRTVNVVDTTSPVITLTGANPQTIEVGTAYSELGATATDNLDAANTLAVVPTVNNENTAVVGSFTVDYNVSDAAGNPATTITRTIHVVDTTVPVITLTGANPQTIEVGTAYSELGATATDNLDAANSLAVVPTVNNENTAVVGSFTVDYNVSDAAGNPATTVTRTVNVVDTTVPTAIAQNVSVQLDANGSASITAAQVNNGSSDNVTSTANLTLSIDNSTFDCSDIGSSPQTNGKLYFRRNDKVISLDTSNNTQQELFTVTTPWANSGSYDEVAQKLFYTAGTSLYKSDLDGSNLVVLSSTMGNPSDMTIDPDNQVIYVSNNNTGIVKINYDGSGQTNLNSGVRPYGIYLDRLNQKIYYADINSNRIGSINTDGTGQILQVIGFSSPRGVYYDAEENEIYASSHAYIQKHNLTTGAVTTVVNGKNNLAGIAVDKANNKLYWLELHGTNNIGQSDLDGTNSTNLFTGQGNMFFMQFGQGGSVSPTKEVTLTVTDEANNSSTATALVTVQDLINPTVSISGNSTVTHEAYTAYTDAGAVASDNCSATISEVNNVPPNPAPGQYTIVYTATDGSGNTGSATRTVSVTDTTPPSGYSLTSFVSLVNTGNEASFSFEIQGIEVNSSYDWTITDSNNTSLSGSGTWDGNGQVIITQDVSNLADGTLTITLTSTDTSTNTGDPVDVTTIKDATVPSGYGIVNATNPINLTNETIVSFEITALETDSNFEWTITDGVTTLSGSGSAGGQTSATVSNVDVSSLLDGVLTISVTETDASQNQGVAVTASTNKDTEIPIIILTATNPLIQEIEVYTAYSELGATATDNIDDDGTITNTISINTDNVDITTVGSYTVTYNVSDAAGNPATEVTRTVEVVDTTIPTITLVGDNPQVLEVEDVYTELGATATDNYDTNPVLTNSIVIDASNAINNTSSGQGSLGTLGTYTVTYNLTDINGNIADQVTRTVEVVDTTKPVITLVGDNPQIVDLNTIYNEQGATALDNYNGDITNDIQIDATAIDLTTVDCYPVTYTVSDEYGNLGEKTRNVFVLEYRKPFAKGESFTVNQDSANHTFVIIDNDSYGLDGPNADHPIAISGTHTDAGSEIELVGNTVVYTPRPGYSGADGFSYTITDASGDSSTATVSITVIEVATPTAVDDIVADVPQDSATREINVLVNDNFGTDGAAATGSLTVDASGLSTEGGTIEVNAQNNIDYTPGPGYFGPDSFSYTITDADGDQDTAVVTINVTKKAVINGVPLAKADAISVTQNSIDNALNVYADNGSGADSFGDDGAADGGLTMISGATSGDTEQGTIVINDKNTDSPLDDTITYTPNPGYTGLDHFYYMITDVSGDTAIAQVTITVAESDTPTALADPVSVGQDSGVNTLDVLANDSFGSDGPATVDALVIDLANYTGGATLAVNAGKVEYTPAAGFDGVDTFNYTITDGSGDTSTATVTVTVSGVVASAVPVAQDDAVTVTENTEDNVINILDDNGNGADDYGTEGASLTHPISGVPLYTDLGGKLVLVGNTVLYTPKTDFSGVDSFSYTITDTKGIADAATVTITVVGIPVALAATNDEFDVVEGSTLNELDVLDNDDYGSNGAAATDALVIDATTNLNGATIDVVAGKVVYTPASGFSGDDTFEYVITDANAATSRATVTVSVGAVVATTAPVAQDDAVSVVQDSQENVINILDDNGNGVDSYGTEGPNLTHPISGVPAFTDLGGELQLVGNTVLYTPRAGFVGEDSFSYKITDTKGIADDATVTITVTTAPDVLTATDDDFAVDQDSNDNTLDVLDNDVLVAGAFIASYDAVSTNNGMITYDDKGTSDKTDDVFLYTPFAGSTAEDTFMYTLSDGTTTSTATVTVTIGATPPTNDTPTAQDDAVTVLRNSENNVINILDDNGNGADSYGLDGPNANHPIAGIPAYTDLGGKLELVGNTVLYTPRTAYFGTDRFSYTITDENGDADTAEVTITVALSKTEDTASFQRDLQVYPNPSKGDVQVTLYSAKAQEASVVLFDVTGKVVYQQQQTLAVGNNTLQFHVKVKAGIMLLKVYSSNTNFGTRKVVFE